MVYNPDYECSSEGAIRHWEIPYARLEHVTPLETEAAAVLSLLPGTQLTGTVLTINAGLTTALIDFTNSMVYRHLVRNVRTYNIGAEATWGVLNIGDPVYYDRSATMIALDLRLSTSPLDNAAGVNPLFGHVVAASIPDMANWPSLVAGAATVECPVCQIGAGG